MVARAEMLDAIYKAIYTSDDECRIVSIQGKGGLGKTRLLEEVLRRFRHKETEELYGALPDDQTWPTNNIAYCHPIDFTDIKAHTREYFIGELGDRSRWHSTTNQSEIEFRDFQRERENWQHLINQGSAHADVAHAAGKALTAFWGDFKLAADSRRLVVLLDTTEQLAIISSKWLIDRGLITTKDTAFATQRWLLDQIEAGRFYNTTLLIAGRDRPEDGELFFQDLRAAAAAAGVEFTHLPIEPFTLLETREYFQALMADWQDEEEEKKPLADVAKRFYDRVIRENEPLRVLHLYTGGQPVRLALYSDIIIEGGVPPDPLQDTWAEALQRIGLDPSLTDVVESTLEGPILKRLDTTRNEIERDFIRLLFQTGRGLQPLILKALARAPRGLDAEQLHFVLHSSPVKDHSKPQDRIETWRPQPEKVGAIKEMLNHIQRLAIVRAKPDGRYGLQDEIYRIFAERMSDDQETRRSEMRDRRRLYTLLLLWAEHRRRMLMRDWRELVKGEIARIQLKDFTHATEASVRRPSPSEQERRQKLSAELLEAELERVHYRLRLWPDVQFNVLYVGLVTAVSKAYEEARAATLQAEAWRVLTDRDVRRFVDLKTRAVLKNRNEEPYDVLLRAVEQDDAVQWILRLVVYKDYKRAIELADAIEREVATLKDPHERHSWNHTLARADRACWREFARIYQSEDRAELETAVEILNQFADDLEKLAAARQSKMVFPDRDEQGFIGHPAEDRVKIVLSQLCNNQGYGYVLLGDFKQAVLAYTRSLQALRTVSGEETEILQAVTRNNLSRALAELGKPRAVEVCQDGLELRMNHGTLVPIGYSFNTLALIWNDFRRPKRALEAGQKALAIGKYTTDSRLRGLALLQVGEALRRIAGDMANNEATETSHLVDDIFQQATGALNEAFDIFIKSESSRESVRGIETNMELGSLYRDWTRHTINDTPVHLIDDRLKDARRYLDQALMDSQGRGLHHLELDARVNIAQAHYYAGQYDAAEEELDAALQTVPVGEQFQLNKNPPTQDDCLSYNLKQLSKLHGLRGEMAFTQLFEHTKSFASEHSRIPGYDRQRLALKDEEIQGLLKKAAVAYTLATSYAQLYSPGSELLAILYKDLYGWVKELNATEMRQFYRYERAARRDYRTNKVKLENQGDLESFLLDCFGDFYEPRVRISEADVSAELVMK